MSNATEGASFGAPASGVPMHTSREQGRQTSGQEEGNKEAARIMAESKTN